MFFDVPLYRSVKCAKKGKINPSNLNIDESPVFIFQETPECVTDYIITSFM